MRLELVTASLLSEVGTIQPGEPFWVAVELTMLEGWHVNWINPGDAGLAPAITWKLPNGFQAGDLMWPYPSRFDLPALSIYGYEGRVLLLARITPPKDIGRGKVTIGAHVDWLACKNACVPGQSDAALSLDVGPQPGTANAEWVRLIEQSRSMLPVAPDGWRFRATLAGDDIRITAVPPVGSAKPENVTFFPTDGSIIEHAEAQVFEGEPGGGYHLDVPLARMSTERPSRIQGVLVSSSGWGTISQKALSIDIPVDS